METKQKQKDFLFLWHNRSKFVYNDLYDFLSKGSAAMSLIENLTKEEIIETSMIDIMYYLLEEEQEPVDFYTIMDKIAEYKGWSKRAKDDKLVQAYTDINIDGRFVALGANKWGLKGWYPVEQTEEELVKTIKPKEQEESTVEEGFDDYDAVAEEELEEVEVDEIKEDEDELDGVEDEDKLDEDDEEILEDDEEIDIPEEDEDA